MKSTLQQQQILRFLKDIGISKAVAGVAFYNNWKDCVHKFSCFNKFIILDSRTLSLLPPVFCLRALLRILIFNRNW
jgi:hypothetical protein